MHRQQKQIIASHQTDRVWLLGRYPLDHRFPSKQIGSDLWAASYGPSLSIKIDRLWPLERHPLSAVRARDNGSSGGSSRKETACGKATEAESEMRRAVASSSSSRALFSAGILGEAKPTVMAMHGLSADSIRQRKSRTDEQNQIVAPENRCMGLFLAMPNHSVLPPSL